MTEFDSISICICVHRQIRHIIVAEVRHKHDSRTKYASIEHTWRHPEDSGVNEDICTTIFEYR